MAEASGDATDYAIRHRSSLLLLNARRNPSSKIASAHDRESLDSHYHPPNATNPPRSLANFANRDTTCRWQKASGDATDYAIRHQSSLLLLNARRNPSSKIASPCKASHKSAAPAPTPTAATHRQPQRHKRQHPTSTPTQSPRQTRNHHSHATTRPLNRLPPNQTPILKISKSRKS